MIAHNDFIPILYGSQTGNSKYISELIEKSLLYGYNEDYLYNIEISHYINKKENNDITLVTEMDSFNLNRIKDQPLIIFICSTHGDGSEPFNMKNFWKFLKLKDLPTDFLKNLSFAVFGLGDSSYEKFNFCSKRLFNRLKLLGATPIIYRGDGDSQDKYGYLTTLKPWLKKLCEQIPDYSINRNKFQNFLIEKIEHSAILTKKEYLTPKEYFQSVLELSFKIDTYDNFYPGDCIGILPSNYNYKEFLNYNDLNFNECVDLVRHEIDYNTMPTQLIFGYLRCHLIDNGFKNKLIIEKLYEFFKNYDSYYNYILKPKRTFFEVLKELKIKINLEFIKIHLPRIYPRYFTVTKIKNTFSITISLIKYKTMIQENRRGLCSVYLKDLEVGSNIKIRVGSSSLYFESKNLLFICTGSGITLPRSCINYFKFKNIVIFYGFRYIDKDFLYRNELSNINNNNIDLYTAISREKDKKYVQDIFKENVVQNIDDYLIFVSGNSRLNKEMKNLFKRVYGKEVFFQSETW